MHYTTCECLFGIDDIVMGVDIGDDRLSLEGINKNKVMMVALNIWSTTT